MSYEVYGAVIRDNIKEEIARRDFIYNDYDNSILKEMLQEINKIGYKFNYLAEVEAYKIPEAASIIKKYICRFSQEATRAYLIPNLLEGKDKERDELLFAMYLNFKNSQDYTKISSAHIYVRYDNAFSKIKPKALKRELVELVKNPRDAFYLPFTTRMLASWKLPELKEVLISYIEGSKIKAEDLGLKEDDMEAQSSLSLIRKELKFSAIYGLKYYLSDDVVNILKNELKSDDKNIKVAVEKTLKHCLHTKVNSPYAGYKN